MTESASEAGDELAATQDIGQLCEEGARQAVQQWTG